MQYITVQEAAQKWGVTPRRVQMLCNEEKILGAVRFGKSWMIPSTAVLESTKKKTKDANLPMPKKSPFLNMTSLYTKVGEADKCVEALIGNPEAQALFAAEIAYCRGEIDKVIAHATEFLRLRSGFYAVNAGGMLLALAAMWRGDISLYRQAKIHICNAPWKTPEDKQIMRLSLACIDSAVRDLSDYPDWFRKGQFEHLHPDSHPAAKVFYIKYLYMAAFAIASKQLEIEGVQGLALMRLIPYTIEPMITQAEVDRTVLPEIYLRLSCAVAYHNSGNKKKAIAHIDKAIAMALPDRFYGLLTEYIRHFDGLLEERIRAVDPMAAEIVISLASVYGIGWAKLSGAVRNRYIATNLTSREREVAKLVAFGFTTKDISSMLYISESTVKQTVLRVVQKTGVKDRSEFSNIL